jgi:hypothetical protein
MGLEGKAVEGEARKHVKSRFGKLAFTKVLSCCSELS